MTGIKMCNMWGNDIIEGDWSDRKHIGIENIQNFIKFVEKFSLQIYETACLKKEANKTTMMRGCWALIVAD